MNPWLERYRLLTRSVVEGASEPSHEVSPTDATPTVSSPDGDGQQALWEIADVQAAALNHQGVSWPSPAGLYEPLQVGSRCPVCARHLYVEREGRLWCNHCLCKNRP